MEGRRTNFGDAARDVTPRLSTWTIGPETRVDCRPVYKYRRIVIRSATRAKNLSLLGSYAEACAPSVRSTIMLHSHQVSSPRRRQKLLPVETSHGVVAHLEADAEVLVTGHLQSETKHVSVSLISSGEADLIFL